MQDILPYVQILLSVLLMAAILLQQRGAGAGSAFGGEGGSYSSRRGIEKTLFSATIVMTVLFFLSAAMAIVLR